jgi:hypothetical protein
MADVKDCPQCGLVNPPAALHCDCGYDFTDRRPTRPYGKDANLTPVDWVVCLLLPVIGLILGVIRLVQGKPSGRKMVAVSAAVTVVWIVMRFTLLAGSR